MTVKELNKVLSRCEDNAEVFLQIDTDDAVGVVYVQCDFAAGELVEDVTIHGSES